MRVERASPTKSSLIPADWAGEFLARGWLGRPPWVVIQQSWSSRRRSKLRSERPTGYAFDLVSLRVLDAPMCDRFASDATKALIVDAIREYPARRAAHFAEFERPMYDANGYSPELLEQMAPRADEPLNDRRFKSPILLVAAEPGNDGYTLLGGVISFDAIMEHLVARDEVRIDEALALMILLSCHGKPGQVRRETQEDGTEILRRADLESAFMRPFHQRRFNQVRAALRNRGNSDSSGDLRAEVMRLLAAHVPRVVASLRRDSPSKNEVPHSVARHRLVEVVSNELGLVRKRSPRRRWWMKLGELPERKRRRFYKSLTPAQRSAVHAVRRGSALEVCFRQHAFAAATGLTIVSPRYSRPARFEARISFCTTCGPLLATRCRER